MHRLNSNFIAVIFLISVIPSVAALPNLPPDSIYHVDSNWTSQDNLPLNISDLQGKVQLVAFVYTYCEHSCPFIIAMLKRIEKAIPESSRSQVQISLISLDPSRDRPEVLNRYMRDHGLEQPGWQMLNGDPDDVLDLSVLLGVRYKPMDAEGKEISHSNMITLLDKQGRVLIQLKGLNQSVEPIISAISHGLKIVE